jgi:SLBB domain-containing protein
VQTVDRMPHTRLRPCRKDRCLRAATTTPTTPCLHRSVDHASRTATAMTLIDLTRAAERMQPQRKNLARRIAGILVLATSLTLSAGAASAQQSVLPRVGLGATRGDLEGYLAQCEHLASLGNVSPEERNAYLRKAAVVRERLSDGDFRVGDQVVLSVQGFDSLSKTFVVRDGELLSLPGIPDIPLHGVLRAEIRPYLTAQLSRYLRGPDVRATVMLRMAVLGEVRSPGFYRIASDVPLSEVLMAAGGPTSSSDIDRAVVRRGDHEVLSHEGLRDALAAGATLDQLNLRAGDEIFVAARSGRNWQTIIQTTAIVASAFVALRAAHLRF